MGGGITRTSRTWTHTSDDRYIYQLSLVVATATVSFCIYFSMFGISHAVQMKRSSACKVIVEVLVLGLLVAGYKIPYIRETPGVSV